MPCWLTNRERRRAPRRVLYWCHSCDRQRVAEGAKCGTCGRRNGRRRNKR